jgi:soluble lytic murein transglycosylase
MGDAEEAVHYYDVAAGSGATSPFVHRAKYWAARVTEGEGRAVPASQRYVQLAQGPKGEFTEEAAFRAGYVLFEVGDTTGALAAWDALTAGASARLEYWRGKALQDAGDAAGARTAFERAVALGPLDLHGIEAARELGQGRPFDVSYRERDLSKSVDWAAIASWLSLKAGGGAPGSPATAACELMAAGLRPAAAAEIRAADSAGDTWRTFELMREARECGLTDVAAQLAVSLRIDAGAASYEVPPDLLRVSYPIDFGATVKAEASKAGIDPLFFASLIRQESFWDPSAYSIADARGLTQVIQPTGEAIASALGVTDFTVSDLFRPALSLEFGAYYLGGQVREYGNALLALSAYNAGPGNAHRWKDAGPRTPAEIVETIDFVETKAYVTYIFEAYAHYQQAWGE